MASLTTTSQSLKKITPFLIFGLIILILAGAIIYRLTNKPKAPLPVAINPPEITQNPSQQQPRSFDFSNIQIPDSPKKLPVYAVKPYNMTEATTTTLAFSLGFSGNPSSVKGNTLDGEQYSWNMNNLTLTVSQTNLEYHNNEYRNRTLSTVDGLPLDQLREKVDSFIQKVGLLGESLTLRKTEYQVISGLYRLPVENFEDVQIIEFSFGKQLSNVPLVNNYPDSGFARVRITKDGEVTYLTSRFFDKFSESGSYDLKTAKEAISEIQKGQGKVVQTQVLDEKGIPSNIYEHPENIENAKIEKVSLAYFLPNDIKDSVQPIFVFEGSFKTNKNEGGKVVIYLPAIKQAK